MSKLENNKKKKKDALLNTAFELFITKGIQNTSISNIVEKAGVAKGTFYLYFSDKYAETANIRASKRMLDAAGVRYHPLQTELASITLDFRAPESAGIPQKSDADEK